MSNKISVEVNENIISIVSETKFNSDMINEILNKLSLVFNIETLPEKKINNSIRCVTTWNIDYLVSNDVSLANHVDSQLIDPRGIILHECKLWVVNNGSDMITSYDLSGIKLSDQITTRDRDHNSSFPTDIVYNYQKNFSVTNENITKSSLFIISSEHGTVSAFNSLVDSKTAHTVLNMQLANEVSVYRGITLANNTLYLADFLQGHIDVFDSSYNRLRGYYFVDSDTADPIPLDYTPNNIVHIGNYLYILYAKKDPYVTITDLAGPGHGFISVFNLDGSFVRRFTSRGVLNSPWAMIPAPCESGFPSGSFIVGNNGDGRINVFDCNGHYLGPVLGQAGIPITIEGLWGLAPHYTDTNQIFFTACNNNYSLVGSLTHDRVVNF